MEQQGILLDCEPIGLCTLMRIIFFQVIFRFFRPIATMDLSGTVIQIWPFEVLLERLFQEQRSVGRPSLH